MTLSGATGESRCKELVAVMVSDTCDMFQPTCLSQCLTNGAFAIFVFLPIFDQLDQAAGGNRHHLFSEASVGGGGATPFEGPVGFALDT